MKIKCICFVIFFFICNLAYSNVPTLRAEHSSFNFGNVVQNSVSKLNVKLYNDTNELINISRVYATCGCTKTTVDKKKIWPKNYCTLNIEFESGKFKGKQTKYVFVEQENGSKITILIYANVYEEYTLEPNFIKLGENGDELVKEIKLVNNTKKDVFIKKVFCNMKCIKIKDVNKDEFTLNIKRLNGCDGEININVELSNGKTIYNKVFIEKKLKYKFNPKRMLFLNLRKGIKREVNVSMLSKSVFNIISIKPSVSWIKVISKEDLKQGFKIKFSALINEKLKKNNGFNQIEFTIREDDGNLKKIYLPVTYSFVN